jgi:hypothetical protein
MVSNRQVRSSSTVSRPSLTDRQGQCLEQATQEAVVISNVALKHYGTSCYSPYDPIRDKGEKTIKDRWERQDKVKVMEWFIRKVSALQYTIFNLM